MAECTNNSERQAATVILEALATVLEQALDAVASGDAERRFAELFRLCMDAATLAKAGEMITGHPAGEA